MNKGYVAVGVIIVIALAGVGYVIWSGNQNSGEANGTITLGATVSLTGKYSTEGSRVLNGYQLAIKDINDNGGVKVGDKYYNLTLIHYDDGSDATTAAQLYDKLITQDKVDILLGPYSSSIVLSVAPVAESYKIPFVQAGGSSDSIYNQGFQYTFGLYRVASTYTLPLFDWLKTSGNDTNVKTVAGFVEDAAFSNSVWGANDTVAAQKYIKDMGLSVVGTYTYTSDSIDTITSSMTDLKSKGGADIIMTIGHYADAKKVVEEISAQGLKPKAIFGTVGVPEQQFVTELGTKANGAMGFAQWVSNVPESSAPGITKFINEYKAANNNEVPAYHAAGGYAAVQVIAAAVTKAGTFTDGSAVKDALKSIDVNTIWGNVQFGTTGVISGSAYMVQIQDGKIETVYPSVYATSSIDFPLN